MNCLKCGKETQDTQVFCPDCLQIMEQYPIAPETVIHLPKRTSGTTEKTPSRRRDLSTAETISQLQGMIRWLTATVAILSLLLCIVAGLLLYNLSTPSSSGTIGRNYTTIDTGAQP